MTLLKHLLALGGCAALLPALACTTMREVDQSGFPRHQVTRLPENAVGVMFYSTKGTPKARDFRVESAQDKRPLKVRIRAGHGWVRVELVGGFQAGASYQFRYLRAHDKWRYPDAVTVAIEHGAVGTAGIYAVDLAPQPIYRVVTVPSSAGACVESVPAVVREFTYSIPSQLASYGDALEYWADRFTVLPIRPRKPQLLEVGRILEPELDDHDYRDPLPYAIAQYTNRHNAVRAACGTRHTRLSLAGAVSFPEVDDRVYRTAAVEFDIEGNVDDGCDELQALLQGMRLGTPEVVLRQYCGMELGFEFTMEGKALAELDPSQWERALSFFFGMSPTCDMLALAQLWRGQRALPDAATVARFGAALRQGFKHNDPALRDQALHALAYLMAQMPDETRAEIAPGLLAPLLPVFIDELEESRYKYPAELARLMVWSGPLAPAPRERVQALAAGITSAAPHARAVLAANSGPHDQ